MFQLQPSSIYLVKDFEDIAVFPHEASGRFNRTLIELTSVYTVHGEESVVHSATPSAPLSSPSSSAYRAYTGPTQHVPPPRSQLTQRRKSATFRKTLQVVSLSLPNQNKPTSSKASTHLDYKVVTQLVVSLEVGQCSPSQQQVGFEVVLLDSKCFPILDCESTTATEFWKSNRRILVASKTLYTKLTGSSANPKRANSAIDLTPSDEEEEGSNPQPKRCCISGCKKLDEILENVYTIKKKQKLQEFLDV